MFPHGALIGSICAFPGQLPGAAPRAPAPLVTWLEALGWMLCDARFLYVAQYPDLYAVIGNLYGGSFPFFQLPDCRGMFLRGVDDGSGNDPDLKMRTGPAGDPASAGVGSFQLHALETHTHDMATFEQDGSVTTEGTAQVLEQSMTTKTGAPNLASKSSLSPNETRPVNLAVNYIIRVR
jgi:microcystin-dependent protein